MSENPKSAGVRRNIFGPGNNYLANVRYMRSGATRLYPVRFNTTVVSNAAGTALTVTQPGKWSNASDYYFYCRAISGLIMPRNTTRVQSTSVGSLGSMNLDLPQAVLFNIRQAGKGADWFDDPMPMSWLYHDLRVYTRTFRGGWLVEPRADLECTMSQNTNFALGLGDTITYWVELWLDGDMVRADIVEKE